MSLTINNNITSLNAWRNLKQTDGAISKTMEKLSSGLRINRAADDPAGLVISEKMRAQLNGLDTAVKNSEKAISMVQTAEAALDKVGKLLVKIRQLAVDTANTGVNDASMVAANQAELDEAVASITRIANYTQFGTKKLLDGTLGGDVTKNSSAVAADLTFDLATSTTEGNNGAAVTVTVSTAATQGNTKVTVLTGGGSVVLDGISLTITADAAASAAAANLATAIAANTTLAGSYTVSQTGAVLNLINTQYGTRQDNATAAGTAINAAATSATSGVNIAGTLQVGTTSYTMTAGTGLTLADSTGNTISVGTGTGVSAVAATVVGTVDDNSAVFQIGANESQTVTVSIQSTKAISLGKVASYGDSDAAVTAFANLSELTSSGGVVTGGVFKAGTSDQLSQAIGVIDKAIDDIASLRGNLGAVQSDNLQVQLDSLRVSYENLQASESTIRDADMTSEMATFTKFQIMMQAGTAMLAQANQMPNNILQLLR